MVDEDKELNDYNEVLDEIRRFYQTLFSKQNLNETDTQVFLEGLNLPKL